MHNFIEKALQSVEFAEMCRLILKEELLSQKKYPSKLRGILDNVAAVADFLRLHYQCFPKTENLSQSDTRDSTAPAAILSRVNLFYEDYGHIRRYITGSTRPNI